MTATTRRRRARPGRNPPSQAAGHRPGPVAGVVSQPPGLPGPGRVRRAGHADGRRAGPSGRRAGPRPAARPGPGPRGRRLRLLRHRRAGQGRHRPSSPAGWTNSASRTPACTGPAWAGSCPRCPTRTGTRCASTPWSTTPTWRPARSPRSAIRGKPPSGASARKPGAPSPLRVTPLARRVADGGRGGHGGDDGCFRSGAVRHPRRAARARRRAGRAGRAGRRAQLDRQLVARWRRAADDTAQLCAGEPVVDGLDLVEPGLVQVPEWRPAMAVDAKAPGRCGPGWRSSQRSSQPSSHGDPGQAAAEPLAFPRWQHVGEPVERGGDSRWNALAASRPSGVSATETARRSPGTAVRAISPRRSARSASPVSAAFSMPSTGQLRHAPRPGGQHASSRAWAAGRPWRSAVRANTAVSGRTAGSARPPPDAPRPCPCGSPARSE